MQSLNIDSPQRDVSSPRTLGDCCREQSACGMGGEAWHRALCDLAPATAARMPILTTFAGSFALPSLQAFTVLGNGSVETVVGEGISFKTIAKQDCRVVSNPLEAGDHLVVHVLARFPSNVGDAFYLTMSGETMEGLRFGNNGVSLIVPASVVEMDTEEQHLYSVAVDPTYVSLYVDGVMLRRKKRAKTQRITKIALELLGEHADLGALVHAVEVWKLDAPFADFERSGEDKNRRQSLLKSKIALRDLNSAYETLTAFDDLDLSDQIGAMRDLLEADIATRRGFREWIYDEVSSRLPAEAAGVWRERLEQLRPEPMLEVRNLTVRFFRKPNERFALGRILLGRKAETFDVLSGIAFNAYPGDIVGIIGSNGAGKSSLLRAISGVLPIREGEILLRGSHLLLSPGLGIRDELSGRDNIVLACCFMGLSMQEAEKLYPDIVEFSGLEKSIDQAFKFYSDGMKSRLIFSIATAVAPEILMLDELLNAGDISFQRKAALRLEEMLGRTKVVIVVTHSIPFVATKCNKALFISRGRQVKYGEPKEVISHYLNELHFGLEHIPGAKDGAPTTTFEEIEEQSFLPSE